MHLSFTMKHVPFEWCIWNENVPTLTYHQCHASLITNVRLQTRTYSQLDYLALCPQPWPSALSKNSSDINSCTHLSVNNFETFSIKCMPFHVQFYHTMHTKKLNVVHFHLLKCHFSYSFIISICRTKIKDYESKHFQFNWQALVSKLMLDNIITLIYNYQLQSTEIIRLVTSICLSICLFICLYVCTLLLELF